MSEASKAPRLRRALFIHNLLSSIVPLICALLVLLFFARAAILKLVDQTMDNSLQNIKRTCVSQSEETDKRLLGIIKKGYAIAKKEFTPYKRIDLLSGTNKLDVTNQATGKTTTIQLPKMVSGDYSFLKNYTVPDTIVKKVRVKGATSTIFQFHKDKMIRISTNVKKKSGKRAILTYIPKESLVYRTVSSGKAYVGRAMVVGKWTITHYEPIKSASGEIVGALYVGVPAPKSAIFDIVRQTRIGERGYIFIMNSKGQLISHPKLEGKTVINLKDSDTQNEFIREIVANKDLDGKITYTYGPDGEPQTKRLAHYTYFKKWDWIIVSMAEYDDIFSTLSTITKIIIGLLLVLPVLQIIFCSTFARRIGKPIAALITSARKISEGDLNALIDDKTRNQFQETDELIDAINIMVEKTSEVIHYIQDLTRSLTSEADVLSTTSHKLESESKNQAAFIEETTSANEELMAVIDGVSNSTEQQARRVSQTSAAMEQLAASTRVIGQHSSEVSNEARKTVMEGKETERVLHDTTRSMKQISDSSKKIVDIVNIINDVSDQINLLSLNAAIEAARAGEHGKGFAVVAEEISKLADATAQQTKEIESLITTSRKDVEIGSNLITRTTSAITSMIHKIEEAARLIEEIASSTDEQTKGSEEVMSDVEEINRMAEQIASATKEQKSSSGEIMNAITKINDSVTDIAFSATETSSFSQSLKEKSDELNKITAFFKV